MQSDAAVFRYVNSLVDNEIHSSSFRTQESLDEGVKKVREIYKSFDNVGIKDRSMIWNS